ncbi:MAG: methyltransferase domain-containing protein [Deltaproteobacteria bacterium]|nr:methyltransferase domain-containing protein [Deltaproteobacteria bacterium]
MEPDRWATITARYDVVESALTVGEHQLRLSHVRDINALVDAMGPEDFGPDERLPYWATLWPAARGLALHLTTLATPLGRTIELGAGLGLAAIVAALRGADAIATDYEPDALEFARQNARLNRARVAVRQCDWRDWSGAEELAHQFQTVLGADLVYEQRNVDPLAESVAWLLAPGGRAWIADPGRPYLPSLQRALEERGLSVCRIPTADAVILEATFTRGLV